MPAFYHMGFDYVRAEENRDGVASCRAYMTRARHRDVRDRSPVFDVLTYLKRENDVAAARAEVSHTEFFSRGPMSACATWKAIDRAARRADGQYAVRGGHMPRLAIFGEASFPLVMAEEDAIHCAREFAKRMVDRYGCAVEIACHRKGGRTDHMHFLISTRRVDQSGVSSTTIRAMNGIANKISGDRVCDGGQNLSGHAEYMRAMWAEILNRFTEQRVDHRSYKRQGLDIQPTKRVSRKRIEDEARRGVNLWRDERAAFLKKRSQTPALEVPFTAMVRRHDDEHVKLLDHVREQIGFFARSLGTTFSPLVAMAIEVRSLASRCNLDHIQPIFEEEENATLKPLSFLGLNPPLNYAKRVDERTGCRFAELHKVLSPSPAALANFKPIIAMAVAARLADLQATGGKFNEIVLDQEDGGQAPIEPLSFTSMVRLQNSEDISPFARVREQLVSVRAVTCGTNLSPFVAMSIEARVSDARRESDRVGQNHEDQNSPPSFLIFEKPILARKVSDERGSLVLITHKAMTSQRALMPSLSPYIIMAISARFTALQAVRARPTETTKNTEPSKLSIRREIAPDRSDVSISVTPFETAQLERDRRTQNDVPIKKPPVPKDGFDNGFWFAPRQVPLMATEPARKAPVAKTPSPATSDWPRGDTKGPTIKATSAASPPAVVPPAAAIPGGDQWILDFAATVESEEVLEAVRDALNCDAKHFARMRADALEILIRNSLDLNVIRNAAIAFMAHSHRPALQKVHRTVINVKVDKMRQVRAAAKATRLPEPSTVPPLVLPNQAMSTKRSDLASPHTQRNALIAKTDGPSPHAITPRVPRIEVADEIRRPLVERGRRAEPNHSLADKSKPALKFVMDENAIISRFDGHARHATISPEPPSSPALNYLAPGTKNVEDEKFCSDRDMPQNSPRSESSTEKVLPAPVPIERPVNEAQRHTPNAAKQAKCPSLENKTRSVRKRDKDWER